MTNPQSSLENMMMQMRKCCNHPYLFASPIDEHGEFVVDERVLEASGKMQLLDRMLRILKENGNKVLIFFQVRQRRRGLSRSRRLQGGVQGLRQRGNKKEGEHEHEEGGGGGRGEGGGAGEGEENVGAREVL